MLEPLRQPDPDRTAPVSSADDVPDKELENSEAVVGAFLRAYLEDQAAGRVGELAHYQKRFPNFEGLIEREYRTLQTDAELPGHAALDGNGDRYELLEEIGSGGMGVVFRAWDRVLRRTLAMKVLRRRQESVEGSGSRDPHALSRFLEEAQITGQLEHPGIVPVHELGLDADGRVYFTMSLVRGRSFKDILDSIAKPGTEFRQW